MDKSFLQMFKAHLHSKSKEKAKQSGCGEQLGNLGENRSKLLARCTHQAQCTKPQTPVRFCTGMTHRESGAMHRGKIVSFTKFCSVFHPVLPSLTFLLS